MLEGKPWNYHTDLFCIAATAHVLLFDKYIQLQQKDGRWSITQRFSRYLQIDTWNHFFSTLLNQDDGQADVEGLATILETALNEDELNKELRLVVNVLKNR